MNSSDVKLVIGLVCVCGCVRCLVHGLKWYPIMTDISQCTVVGII